MVFSTANSVIHTRNLLEYFKLKKIHKLVYFVILKFYLDRYKFDRIYFIFILNRKLIDDTLFLVLSWLFLSS